MRSPAKERGTSNAGVPAVWRCWLVSSGCALGAAPLRLLDGWLVQILTTDDPRYSTGGQNETAGAGAQRSAGADPRIRTAGGQVASRLGNVSRPRLRSDPRSGATLYSIDSFARYLIVALMYPDHLHDVTPSSALGRPS